MDYRTELVTRAEEEVMACIGCNDCLLACPLPEKDLVSIAELNAAVLAPVVANPGVATFAVACTQCGQCVPVCPADLRRADMVLVNKLKVEDAAPDRPLVCHVGDTFVPAPWTLDGLAAHLRALPLFAGALAADLRRTVLKSTLRRLAPGDVLCREGAFHERLFVILEGAVEQTAADAAGAPRRILVLGPGAFHGETAVLANQPESYTVVALKACLVLEIPRAAVLQLMDLAPAFAATMDQLYREHAVWTHARRSPALAALPETAVDALLADADLHVLTAGDIVAQRGDAADAIYIVRAGFLRVSRPAGQRGEERVMTYFRPGDVFGVQPVLTGDGYAFTVVATTRVELVGVSAAAVTAMLAAYPGANAGLLDRSPDTGPAASATRTGAAATRMDLSLTGLIDRGVLQGREVLVIDQTICTDCDNCVDACGRRHGQSRLARRGIQLGHLLFPAACRHCADPVCLLCSVDGIVRLPDGEITIVAENCIGCGACADRCPYDNIQMHARVPPPVGGPVRRLFFDLLDLARGGRARETALDQLDPTLARVAVKCDLCAGYADYACVTACPVGAAFRVDPSTAFGRNWTDEGLGIALERRR